MRNNMKTIYLISTKDLKDNTPINDNTADYLLNTAIRDAQAINLQQITGTVLYKKILQLVNDDTIGNPENAKYKSLLDDYIQPLIINYAFVYAIPAIRFKFMNVGVVSQSSDNSTPTDTKELQMVLDDARNKAEYYATILSDYLKAHTKDYPEFLQNKEYDEKRPMINQYTSGLVLSDVYPDQFHYNTFPSYL